MQRAIGMVEFSSIARGIYAADQMVKVSEVEVVTASTSCPGKYVAIVHGDVAAVKTSIETGEREAGEYYIDSMVIPNVHPQVFPALPEPSCTEGINALGTWSRFPLLLCWKPQMRFLRRRIWTALNCVWATVWAESLSSPIRVMWRP